MNTKVAPVNETGGRIRHGYTYKTGVFKDTTITTIKNGDTIRTYRTIIVPIKPVKEKF